jgi:hypothetical protein
MYGSYVAIRGPNQTIMIKKITRMLPSTKGGFNIPFQGTFRGSISSLELLKRHKPERGFIK